MADIINIQHFYAGQSVFVTGATGFIGKVLVEKLLRSCPEIGHVYLLIRPKRDQDVNLRFQELITNCQVFEWLKRDQPDALKKLIPVSGDVSFPNLGISPCDVQELAGNVSVVFNLAARIKFDDNLKEAIESNVKGPKNIAILCRQFKNLKAFVHVSTVYNNVNVKEMEEKIYPASLDPQKLLNLVDSMDDRFLISITKQLLGNFPNVYAFTKALGENILADLAEGERRLPLVIVRPSIVGAAAREPTPGWIDHLNVNGGVMAGIMKGIIYTIKANEDCKKDLMPVDISINLIIAAAWDRGICDALNEPIAVYNCTSGSLNPIRWKDFKRWGLRSVYKFPCKEMMRYPNIQLRTNNFIYESELVLYHHIPAFFVDIVARLSGRKPFLARLYQRAHKVMSCVEFYNLREWNFASRNVVQLMDKMSDEDRNTFNFDVRQINWELSLDTCVTGVRKFLLKDDLSTLSEAKNNLKRMKRLRALVRLFIWGLLGLIFFCALWCKWCN